MEKYKMITINSTTNTTTNTTTHNVEFRRKFNGKRALKNTTDNVGMLIVSNTTIPLLTVGGAALGAVVGGMLINDYLHIPNNSPLAIPGHIAGVVPGAVAGAVEGLRLAVNLSIYDPIKSTYKGIKNIRNAPIKNPRKLIIETMKNKLDFGDGFSLENILTNLGNNHDIDNNDKKELIIKLHTSDLLDKTATDLGANDDNKEVVKEEIFKLLNIGTLDQRNAVIQQYEQQEPLREARKASTTETAATIAAARALEYGTLPIASDELKASISSEDMCIITHNTLDECDNPVILKTQGKNALIEFSNLQEWATRIPSDGTFKNPETQEELSIKQVFNPEDETKRMLFRINKQQ
jgi:hypothetical protein